MKTPAPPSGRRQQQARRARGRALASARQRPLPRWLPPAPCQRARCVGAGSVIFCWLVTGCCACWPNVALAVCSWQGASHFLRFHVQLCTVA